MPLRTAPYLCASVRTSSIYAVFTWGASRGVVCPSAPTGRHGRAKVPTRRRRGPDPDHRPRHWTRSQKVTAWRCARAGSTASPQLADHPCPDSALRSMKSPGGRRASAEAFQAARTSTRPRGHAADLLRLSLRPFADRRALLSAAGRRGRRRSGRGRAMWLTEWAWPVVWALNRIFAYLTAVISLLWLT